MTALSHPLARLSMCLLGAATMTGSALAAPAATSVYYGRWTVADEQPVFTPRGRMYKTIDVAPCGNDFCGVSVGDQGQCGPTLFRFLSRHAAGTEDLHGHGRWGEAKKNILIYTYEADEPTPGRQLEIYLGDGYDLGERSDNMPKFHAAYRKAREATCRAR